MFDFKRQDPEFAERFEHFAFDEVVNDPLMQDRWQPIRKRFPIRPTSTGIPMDDVVDIRSE